MVLVLFSGGIDSATLAQRYSRSSDLGGLLFFDYDQPAAKQEREAATKFAEGYRVPLFVIKQRLHGVDQAMGTGGGEPGPRILPGRNLWMIASALNLAACEGFDLVVYGATAADTEYPDCSPAFVRALDQLAQNDVGISVAAPLIDMTKADVVREAMESGVDLRFTWSCYEPIDGKQCGRCNSCKEVARAMGPLIP